MTIRFLKSLQGNYEGQIVSGLATVEETRLIGLGYASYDLDGEASNIIDAKLKTTANGDINGLMAGDGKTITGLSTLRDKIRKAYAKSVAVPYYSTFWNEPEAWLTGQLVYIGEARSSNGNWYVAITTGTSGAFAPSLYNPLMTQPYSSWNDGAIDGSGTAGVSWAYYSAIQPVYNGDLGTTVAVAFSNVTNAALTNTYTPITGNYGTPTGFVRDGNANSTKQFVPVGAGCTAVFAPWVGDLIKSPNASSVRVYQTSGGALGMYASVGNKNNTGNDMAAGYFEINTDSLSVQFATSKFDSGSSNAGGTRVIVDGVEVSPTASFVSPATYAAVSGTANLYTNINFTGVVKVRNIKIIGLTSLREVKLAPNAALHYVKDEPLKILWVGDSISAGSALSPSRTQMQWPNLVANEIGIQAVTNASIGGTGFESSGSGYDFYQRFTDVTNTKAPLNSEQFSSSVNKYDIVVIQASGNDGTVSTTLQQRQLDTFRRLRELQPDALIIVHGAWPGGQSYAVSADYCDGKAQLAFAEWGDSKSFYIKTRATAAGGAWITGTGYNKSGFTSATGNSSLYVGSDATHPNDAGIMYYAKRTVDALLQYLDI